jgi:Xaa-Pro aminopeptidase
MCNLFSEPGYYLEGHFGVRLENVLEVVKKKTKVRQ